MSILGDLSVVFMQTVFYIHIDFLYHGQNSKIHILIKVKDNRELLLRPFIGIPSLAKKGDSSEIFTIGNRGWLHNFSRL